MSKLGKFSKKLPIRYLIWALLIATIISTVTVSGVFASYRGTAKGTGTAMLAKWGFLANINGVSCLDTDWGAAEVDGGYSINNLSIADVNYMDDQKDVLETKEKVINVATGRKITEYYSLAPGSSGLLSIEVNPAYSDLPMLNKFTIEFVNLPTEIKFTDIYGMPITPVITTTTVGEETIQTTIISYSTYFSYEEILALRAWNTRSGITNYVECGIRWSWATDATGSGYIGDSSFKVTVIGRQVVSSSDFATARKIHFTNGGSDGFLDGYVNVLMNDLSGGINASGLTKDTMFDLHGHSVAGLAAIDSSENINIGIGTRVQTSGAESAARQNVTPGVFTAEPVGLMVTAPKASVYVAANSVCMVSVSSGSNSYHHYGMFVMSEEEAAAASGEALVTEKSGDIFLRGGNLVVDDVRSRKQLLSILIKQDASPETADATIVINSNAYVDVIDARLITKAITLQNAGVISKIVASTSHYVNYVDIGGTVKDRRYADQEKLIKVQAEILDESGRHIAFYPDIQSAIDNVQDGYTVKLCKNVLLTETLEINNYRFAFDLNRYKISAEDALSIAFKVYVPASSGNKVDITLKNGTIDTKNVAFAIGEASIGSIAATDLIVRFDSNLTVIAENDSCLSIRNAATIYSTAQIKSYDASNATIVTNALDVGTPCVININGGLVYSRYDEALYLAGNSELYVTSGTVSAKKTAVEIMAGELKISGGKFIANENPGTDSVVAGERIVGAAVAVSQHEANLPINVNISGGVFNGYWAFREVDTYNNGQVDNITLMISGGTFNCTPKGETTTGSAVILSASCKRFIKGGIFSQEVDSKYVASAYTCTLNNDKYTVHTIG